MPRFRCCERHQYSGDIFSCLRNYDLCPFLVCLTTKHCWFPPWLWSHLIWQAAESDKLTSKRWRTRGLCPFTNWVEVTSTISDIPMLRNTDDDTLILCIFCSQDTTWSCILGSNFDSYSFTIVSTILNKRTPSLRSTAKFVFAYWYLFRGSWVCDTLMLI